jgi:hypothetical protein
MLDTDDDRVSGVGMNELTHNDAPWSNTDK